MIYTELTMNEIPTVFVTQLSWSHTTLHNWTIDALDQNCQDLDAWTLLTVSVLCSFVSASYCIKSCYFHANPFLLSLLTLSLTRGFWGRGQVNYSSLTFWGYMASQTYSFWVRPSCPRPSVLHAPKDTCFLAWFYFPFQDLPRAQSSPVSSCYNLSGALEPFSWSFFWWKT